MPAILGLSAVQEFAQRGLGTPVPYDPPKRLVSSGVYAYIANPMQLSITLLLIGLGGLLESLWVSAAGLMAFLYSAGLAAWDEGEALERRFGQKWVAYRQVVRPWWPRRRPWQGPPPIPEAAQPPAHLYVATGCDPCSELGNWLQKQKPVNLLLIAAEDHPTRTRSPV